MAELAILLIGLLLNGLGILGCIMPVLPGPILSWCSLLLFSLLPDAGIGYTTLLITAILMLVISIADYFIPILGARKFGSSKQGIWGGTIGIVVGLFFAPWGIVLGPLFGTIIGDLLAGGTIVKALKSGFGSLVGFVVGTTIKLIYCIAVLVIFTLKAGATFTQLLTQWIG